MNNRKNFLKKNKKLNICEYKGRTEMERWMKTKKKKNENNAKDTETEKNEGIIKWRRNTKERTKEAKESL